MNRRVFSFVRASRWAMIGSAAAIVLGLVFVMGKGLTLGIDFTGGTLMDLRFDEAVSPGQVRGVLEQFDLGTSVVKLAGAQSNEVLITTKPISDETRDEVLEALGSSLGDYETVRLEEVRGTISRELSNKAYLAAAVACAGMLAYITLRFEFGFGLAAVLALLHDVLVTVGVVAIAGIEVNTPFVAAVLTIIGYSINDTIIIFDRIRENLKGSAGRGALEDLVDLSISETLTRSINTSVTTLLAIGAVLVFGGRTTRDFAFALFLGIAVGTYSSIFIASPLWLWLRRRGDERARRAAGPRPGRKPAQAPGRPRARQSR